MKKKIIGIVAVIAIAAAAVFGYMIWSAGKAASEAVAACNAAVQEYNEKIAPCNEAAAGIAAANAQLQKVLDEAAAAIRQGKEAYEPDTLDALREAVQKGEKALVSVPAQIDPFAAMESPVGFDRRELEAQKLEAEAAQEAVREAMTRVPPLPEIPDYADEIAAVQDAQKAYTDSVRRLANVTAPADAFVRERVRGLETVVQTAAVSGNRDPNGLLGKKGGYLGCVYFLDARIDLDLLPAEVLAGSGDSEETAAEGTGQESSEESAEGMEPESSEEPAEGTEPEKREGAEGSTDSRSGAEAAAESAAPARGETAVGTVAEAGASAEEGAAATGTSTGEAATASGATAASAEPAAGGEEEEENRYDVVAAGTDGGGAVEVYATAEEAQARDEYLAFFAGSVMDPGAHSVEGTCVIRASRYLEADQQQALLEAVRAALLKVE